MNRLYSSRLILFSLIVLVLTLTRIPNSVVHATAGDLDLTFGTGGKVTTSFFGQFNSAAARAVALQSDGKIIAVGDAANPLASFDFAMARFNSDGSLDGSFGTDGKITTDFGEYDLAQALAIQPDGKIVVAGSATEGPFGRFAVARYNSNGSLDATFGSGGKVITTFFGFGDGISALALQSDGKIVAAGSVRTVSGFVNVALTRYNPDGSLDSTFGSGGKLTTVVLGFVDFARSLVIQPDGKLLIAGDTSTTNSFPRKPRWTLVRYNSDGSLDSTFGSGGKVVSQSFGQGSAWSVALQKDNKIVVAGDLIVGDSSDFALARYNIDGSVDTTFASGGKVTTDIQGNFDSAHALVIRTDGKIIAGGSAIINSPTFYFAITAYNPNGSLDTTFGIGGKITTSFFGVTDHLWAMALQPDGKLIAAGNAQPEMGSVFALARYNMTTFDLCIQDESNGNILQVNTTTGDYQFTNCGGLTIGGTGTLTQRGNQITLQHNAADRRVMAKIDTSTNKATASIQLFSSGRTFSITDRNIANNTCACR